jgi:RNA polymerase sigma factor (sigma-70 family)
MDSAEVTDVVRRAAEGEQAAWKAIVDEYGGVVQAVARGYRLSEGQTADAVQTTWLRLVEHLSAIREPDRLAGWLATTTRRECLAILRKADREQPTDSCDDGLGTSADPCWAPEEAGPEVIAVRQDHRVLVRRALATLPEQHRMLIGLLASSPTPSYQEISAGLGMPTGSIGPTRKRILARLRVELEAAGLHDMSLN